MITSLHYKVTTAVNPVEHYTYLYGLPRGVQRYGGGGVDQHTEARHCPCHSPVPHAVTLCARVSRGLLNYQIINNEKHEILFPVI